MYNKNILKDADNNKLEAITAFCEDYKAFISEGKTERLFTALSKELAVKNGFKDLDDLIKNNVKLKPGDKVFAINRNKNIVLFIIGKKPIGEEMRILGAHIDSPRVDVKQNPLYEANEIAYLDTHYYGGIKKYQWVTTPLSLIGVVVKRDGSIIDVNIGEDENDPILGISDLLIHLASDQMSKNGAKVVEGEALDLIVGTTPLKGEEAQPVKKYLIKLLKDKYNIDDEDFVSSELEAVPSLKARDFGLDRSMIAAYGQDDKVCAYTSLKAILDVKEIPEVTSCCILVDKEEIGSVGATGAQSRFFINTISEVLALTGYNSYLDLQRTLTNAKMLSSDVSAAFDPLYSSVFDTRNAGYMNHGICFNKYTGSRGKSGSNDCNAEFMGWVRNAMEDHNVYYQTCELGKVDAGGGGTIAYILGNLNMNVVDAGVAILSMHSPMEIASKADVYEAYLAYKAFLKA